MGTPDVAAGDTKNTFLSLNIYSEKESVFVPFIQQSFPCGAHTGLSKKRKKEEEELKSMIIIANLLTVNAICSLTGKIFEYEVLSP